MNKLIFDDTEVSKKQFYESKGGINLRDVNVNNIVVSNKIEGNNETRKVFIDYLMDDNVAPLCLILPQMSGWIKYFENGGKNINFKREEDWVYLKYNGIWGKIKELLNGVKLSSDVIYNSKIKELLNGVKLSSDVIHDSQYVKSKVKTFSKVIKAWFDGGEISKEKIEYTCTVCISIDVVLRIDKEILSTC